MQKSSFANQQGFTLLESLIALGLFAIIVLGSSAAIKHMLSTQRDMNISFVVINEMQKRLQQAQDKTHLGNICDRVNTTAFSVNDQLTYYFGCATTSMTVGSVDIEWPVLAASSLSQATAQSCAANNVHYSCYIVGK